MGREGHESRLRSSWSASIDRSKHEAASASYEIQTGPAQNPGAEFRQHVPLGQPEPDACLSSEPGDRAPLTNPIAHGYDSVLGKRVFKGTPKARITVTASPLLPVRPRPETL